MRFIRKYLPQYCSYFSHFLLFSTTFSIYNRGEKHTAFEAHMIPRYGIFNPLFHWLLGQNFFLRHVLVEYDPRIFREIIFLPIRIFFPGLQNNILQCVLQNFTISWRGEQGEPLYDFVFVVICLTFSSKSMQLKKRQKLSIHPIEYTAVFTRYRFLYSNNFITVILFIFPQNPRQWCFPINTIFTTCCSKYGTAKVIIVLNHTHNNWDTRI
jgi:hypothetical protein